MLKRWPILVLVALAVPALARADQPTPADTADLLPAGTLACVEVRQPAKLSREVAALARGSFLEDMPALAAQLGPD